MKRLTHFKGNVMVTSMVAKLHGMIFMPRPACTEQGREVHSNFCKVKNYYLYGVILNFKYLANKKHLFGPAKN